jgi:HEAT repeat protein
MRFVLILLLLLVSPAFGDNIFLDENTPNEVLAVRLLVDHFSDTGYVIRTEPRVDNSKGPGYVISPGPWLKYTPAFVVYADLAAAYGDCAVAPLIEALEEDGQIRMAAAVGLEKIGPTAMRAKPQLIEMLNSSSVTDNILACGIIRGIGPDAVEFTSLLGAQLDNENFHAQYWACRALSAIGPGAGPSADQLIVVLREGVASVRRNAAIALGSIAVDLDGKSKCAVINALEQSKKDYSAPVREAVLEALRKLRTITNGKVA